MTVPIRRCAAHIFQESEPGEIVIPPQYIRGHLITPPQAIYPGHIRYVLHVWQDGPRFRLETSWEIAPPPGFTTLAMHGAPPRGYVFASDGDRNWTIDHDTRQVWLRLNSEVGTWPSTNEFLFQFARYETVDDLLTDRLHCTTPRVCSEDTILERSVVVIEFGADECRWLKGPRTKHPLSGRARFWIDTETFVTLRQDQYAYAAYAEPDRLLLRTEVTSLSLDPHLPDELFDFVLPTGYRLNGETA
jgi:outer membrane lipoprotein-sorting protein